MNILKLLKPKAVIDYIYDDATVRQAIEKMRHHGFTAIPVINKKGEYVKTLAEGDFLYFMLENSLSDIKELENYSVKEITKRVKNNPVYIYSTIEDLILLSMNQNFVPVIDDRKVFIGIVTRRDILQYCYNTIKDGDPEYGKKEEEYQSFAENKT
ncbi:CBS domain-containing protein [Ruminococcus sp. Marseille-P6503]|uniref:CBS domain-containing protein n=1 Tax=Ruminococcus sp. Marseille-P6503 TaxID=2364796 RepID=UPI000F5342F2|nr:CBS domain-containing protein [Ruminococcus sp. Marseille-P6503]